jgi:ABC-type enterochelin transport system substrate-binding protein
MSDFFQRVTSDQDPLKKLASYIPGFSGYVERENRRAADKLMRDTIARHFEQQYKRLSALQADLISQGGIEYVDDLEKAALQMRIFTDKLRNATYGYSGLFDSVKINQDELAKIYAYDAAFFDTVEAIKNAIDTVEANLGNTDGLPAVIRNLVTLTRQAVDAFDRRYEVFSGTPK